jgi:hypothetical protein
MALLHGKSISIGRKIMDFRRFTRNRNFLFFKAGHPKNIVDIKRKCLNLKQILIMDMELKLFSSFDFEHFTLKNRMVMAPMTRCRAIDNIPNDLMATWDIYRATG